MGYAARMNAGFKSSKPKISKEDAAYNAGMEHALTMLKMSGPEITIRELEHKVSTGMGGKLTRGEIAEIARGYASEEILLLASASAYSIRQLGLPLSMHRKYLEILNDTMDEWRIDPTGKKEFEKTMETDAIYMAMLQKFQKGE